MAQPCALFSSSSSQFLPQDFVKEILKVSELPPPDVTTTDIKGYEWDINTKYYTTKIHLCTTESRTIGDQAFAESLEAFIHFFDPSVPSSFDLAKAWLPYLTQLEPQVQMLVCKCAKDSDAVSRKSTLVWCIENGFELVELEPEEDSDDEDNDFPETTGFARIIQALHAHTWPNLEMKDSPPIQSPLVRQMMREQHLLNKEQEQNNQNSPTVPCADTTAPDTEPSVIHATVGNVTNTPATDSNNSSETNHSKTEADSKKDDPVSLDNVDWSSLIGAVAPNNTAEDSTVGGNDVNADEFEKLFMELKVMKDCADKLPASERKKYAEKVALSFWSAIGGDPDEIGDLDADSD